jgi:hypothetical protein
VIKICVLFFSLLFTVCNGQKNTFDSIQSYSRVAFSLGLSRYTVHDEIVSPLVYRKVSVPIQVQFDHYKKRSSHTASLTFDSPKLLSKQNSNYAKTVYFLLNYHYITTVKSFEKSSVGLGLGSHLNVFYKNQFYKNFGNAQTADIFCNATVQAFFRKKITSKKEFSLRFSYPLISYLIGEVYSLNQPPPALLYDDGLLVGHLFTSGRWTSRVIDFQSVATYNHSVHPRWDLSLSYWFRYYQYNKFPLVQVGVHQFLGSIHYKFYRK